MNHYQVYDELTVKMAYFEHKAQELNQGVNKESAERFLKTNEISLNLAQIRNLKGFRSNFFKYDHNVAVLVNSFMKDVSLGRAILSEGISRSFMAAIGFGKTAAETISDVYQSMQEEYSKIVGILDKSIKTGKLSPEAVQRLVDHLNRYFTNLNTLVEELQNYSASLPNIAKKAFELITDAASIVLLPLGGAGLAIKGAQMGLKGVIAATSKGLSRFLTRSGLQAFGANLVASACIMTALGLHSESEIASFFSKVATDPEKGLTDLQAFFRTLKTQHPQLAHFCTQAENSIKNGLENIKTRGRLDEKDLLRILQTALQASIICSILAVPPASKNKTVNPSIISGARSNKTQPSAFPTKIHNRGQPAIPKKQNDKSNTSKSPAGEQQAQYPATKKTTAGKDDRGIDPNKEENRRNRGVTQIDYTKGTFRSGKDDGAIRQERSPHQVIDPAKGPLDKNILDLLEAGRTPDEVAELIFEHIKRDLSSENQTFLAFFVELHAKSGGIHPFNEIMEKVFTKIAADIPNVYIQTLLRKSLVRSVTEVLERLPAEKICQLLPSLLKSSEQAAIQAVTGLSDDKFLQLLRELKEALPLEKTNSKQMLLERFLHLAEKNKGTEEIVNYLLKDRRLAEIMINPDTTRMTRTEIQAVAHVSREFLVRLEDDELIKMLKWSGPKNWFSILRWLPNERILSLTTNTELIRQIQSAEDLRFLIQRLDENNLTSLLNSIRNERQNLFEDARFLESLHSVIAQHKGTKEANSIFLALGIEMPRKTRLYW